MQTVHLVFVLLMNHYSHNAVHKEKAELLTYCIISYIGTNRFFYISAAQTLLMRIRLYVWSCHVICLNPCIVRLAHLSDVLMLL